MYRPVRDWSVWLLGYFPADGLLQEGRGSPYHVDNVRVVDRDEEYVEAAEGRKFPKGKCAPHAKVADI